MKMTVVFALSLILALTACSGSTDTASSAGTGPEAAAALAAESVAAQGALSPVAQNILGLLKLEDTELAVDPAQAATLLPLWQAYRSLLNSDTTAPAELEALQMQLEEALTAKQRDTIAAMDLSPQDLMAMAQELGAVSAPSDGFADANGVGSNRPDFGDERPDGGGPGGGGPGGMGPPAGGFMPGQGYDPPAGGGGELDPQALATLQARRASGGGAQDRFSLVLLDPLIKLLKERAGS